MKLSWNVLPVFSGLIGASKKSPPAEAYILRQSSPATTPSAPLVHDHAAAAIVQTRMRGVIPETQLMTSVDDEEALSHIRNFGRTARPLFQDTTSEDPLQLVITFAGVTTDSSKSLKRALDGIEPSFTASHLPFLPLGMQNYCLFVEAVDPSNTGCWYGNTNTQYLEYDISEDNKVVDALTEALPRLQTLAKTSKLETTIVLIPQTNATVDLRRRAEPKPNQQMTEEGSIKTEEQPPDAAKTSPGVPAIFKTLKECEEKTNNCTAHGKCINKFSPDASTAAFRCVCGKHTEKDALNRDRLYQWGGSACQKKDVSTPFWLFVGLTILLVSVVGLCISMLFSIGEEKLPGVIGAGVSRSK